MDEAAYRQHRQKHQSEREQQYRAQYAEQIPLRNEPAIGKQERRDKQQEEDLRVDTQRVQTRQVGQQRAASNKQDGQRQRYPLAYRADCG